VLVMSKLNFHNIGHTKNNRSFPLLIGKLVSPASITVRLSKIFCEPQVRL
jgi:hypothetical protein